MDASGPHEILPIELAKRMALKNWGRGSQGREIYNNLYYI
jgi:hypothetical protein